MEPLLEAIYAKISTTPAIIAQFPGYGTLPVAYYADVAPEGAPLPFLVSTVIAAPSTFKYGGESFSQPSIQFAAYGIGRSATYARIKAFVDTFDELTLTLSTGHQTNTYREGQPIPVIQDEKDQSGQYVWQWVVTYDFAFTSY